MGGGKITVAVIGKDGRGWSIDQDRANTIRLLKESGFVVRLNPLFASHIFCVWLDMLLRPSFKWVLWFHKYMGKKIVGAVTNDITQQPEKVPFLKKNIDVCIAPSTKVYDFLVSHGINTVLIPFSVGKNIFQPLDHSKRSLAEQLGVPFKSLDGRVIIGSFQRDTQGADLVTPKWQKNPELIVQVAKRLPKEKIVVLLAGPRRHYVVKRLEEEGVPYVFVGDPQFIVKGEDDYPQNILDQKQMNLLYNLADIYLVSSKSEGGPKAVLEAAFAKTLVISTDVGLAPDILHQDMLYDVDRPEVAAELIQRFIDDPHVFDGQLQYSTDQLKEAFDPERIKKAYADVFRFSV